MGEQHLKILAACVIGMGAFAATGVLTGAADISHLTVEEMELGEHLMETASEADIRAALASVEADLASVERAS